MAPQRRAARNLNLPTGLRQQRSGYFSWKHPITGREYGLGRDRAAAIREAIEANSHVAGEVSRMRLVDRLQGASDRTMGAWCEQFERDLAKRAPAPATIASNRTRFKHTLRLLGADTPIRSVTTLAIADALRTFVDAGQARTAQAMRSFWSDMFRGAQAAGWIDSNPVLITEKVRVQVQRARLLFDQFQTIYSSTSLDWLRNAMALALVSAQRREDVARARFADAREDGWYVQQGKTGARVIVPLELRLDAFGMSLADVFRQCRRSGALSKHVIHQTAARGNSPIGSPIFIDRISKAFAEARDRLDLDWGGKQPATFHEIRSLASRMYKQQGNVDVQALLGHSKAETTQLYQDARGAEWTRVRIA